MINSSDEGLCQESDAVVVHCRNIVRTQNGIDKNRRLNLLNILDRLPVLRT